MVSADRTFVIQSDTDIWNHLNKWVWGKSGGESSPKGDWSAQPTALANMIKSNLSKIGINTDTNTHQWESIETNRGQIQGIQEQVTKHASSPHGGGGSLLGGIGSGLASTGVLVLVGVGAYLYLTKVRKKT